MQNDYARPHSGSHACAVIKVSERDEWNISLSNEPYNYPDLYFLGLDVFQHNQSFQYEHVSANIRDFLSVVVRSASN